MAQQPPVGQGLRVIRPKQRPPPGNTPHSKQTSMPPGRIEPAITDTERPLGSDKMHIDVNVSWNSSNIFRIAIKTLRTIYHIPAGLSVIAGGDAVLSGKLFMKFWVLDLEEKGIYIFRNVGRYSPNDTTSHFWRLESSPKWESWGAVWYATSIWPCWYFRQLL